VYAVGIQGATGGWDHVLTSLDYGDKKAAVEASYALPKGFPFQMSFRLAGDIGCVDFRFGGVTQVDQRAAARSDLVLYRPGAEPELLKPSSDDAYQAEIRYFVQCLQEDRAPSLATLAEAREVLTIVMAAKESLETGQVVSL
jgi:predicted dehydrogenase